MIALLDNGQDLAQCEAEIGMEVGQLLTPLTRYRLRDPERPWAIDNGGFKELDILGLQSLMEREAHHKERCLFVTAPDMFASAQRTIELFWHFLPMFKGWKVAFVVQDGQENLPIPWEHCDAIFIGGTTSWKCSAHVVAIAKTAKLLDKWVHWGRVNHAERLLHAEEVGGDSFDGTGAARYTHMRKALAARNDQLGLGLGRAA